MHETLRPWDCKRLKRWFQSADKITHNYAQSDQDIFVLSMLDGLHNGTYLELGAAWPEHISNTALLEREFGWSGISLESSVQYNELWAASSRQGLVQGNGLTVDYHCLLSGLPRVIDYLSIDCDPGSVSLAVLKRLPHNDYKFRVITFEHECYCEGPAVKNDSREFLISLGYQLVVSNVSHLGLSIDYEDWWVYPTLVDADRLQLHLADDDSIKDHQLYLYK